MSAYPIARRRAILLVVATSFAACAEQTPDATVALDGSASFVGREACVDCHTEAASAWRGSHHDLALDVAVDSTVLGDFDDATFTQHGLTHRFFRRDGRFVVETEGPDGAMTEYEVSHVIGVEPLQQYLVTFPDGRVQTLPLSWDTRPADEGGQRWFHIYGDERIAPDDPLFWTGIQQNFNSQCAECHVTDIRKDFDLESRTYATDWAEIDVSCEACHGPGSLHVDLADAGRFEGGDYAPEEGGLRVALGAANEGTWAWNAREGRPVRTAPTGATDQFDTCARCHARRTPITSDYAAGLSIAATHRPALPRDPLYFHDGQIRDEVYVWGSFLQSRMYQAGVLCTDCHEPHSGDLLADGADVCARCHAPSVYDGPQHDFHTTTPAGEDRGAGASVDPTCLDCHMPDRTYMVVDDRGDHSFRVPRPAVSAEVGSPDACTSCHADRSQEWAASTLIEWYGPDGRHAESHWGTAFHAAAERADRWPQALSALVDDPDTPDLVRAAAVEALGSAHPRHLLSRFLELAAHPDPLVRRSAMEASAILLPEDRVQVAGPGLTDTVLGVRISAFRALAGGRASLSPDRVEAYDAARDEWIDAQMAMAERAESHLNLGVVHAAEGRLVQAEESFRTALSLDSAAVAAWVNLADLYRSVGREEDAASALAAGLDAVAGGDEDDPAAAPLLHARGLGRIRAGDSSAALGDLEAAWTLAPDTPRFAWVLAVARLDLEGRAAALATVESGLAVHPRDPELLSLAVSIHRDAGDDETALEYAARLLASDPGNPDYTTIVLQLGGDPSTISDSGNFP